MFCLQILPIKSSASGNKIVTHFPPINFPILHHVAKPGSVVLIISNFFLESIHFTTNLVWRSHSLSSRAK